MLDLSGTKDTRRFSTCMEDLLNLREWLIETKCQRVAIESTGIYWIPTYTLLEGKVETIVANPFQIKNIPGRKNDDIDSEWIAEVCLNGQIKPSNIPPKEIREIRELTRTHVKLTQARTSFKNRVHKILSRAGVRISGVLTDIFGKSGMIIINGILNGKTIDQTFAEIKDKRIKIKKTEIKESLKGELSQNDIFVIKECLESIKFFDKKIKEFDSKINQNLKGMQKEMEILMSIPGVGFTTAAAIMAEIGNIDVFSKPKKLVGWSGLAPSINESAGKSSNGHITKKGNKFQFLFWQLILSLLEDQISSGFFIRELKQKKVIKKQLLHLQESL